MVKMCAKEITNRQKSNHTFGDLWNDIYHEKNILQNQINISDLTLSSVGVFFVIENRGGGGG